MPKQQKDYLIELISSMTKAEKRSFRLFSNMQNSKDDKLFVILFDYLDNKKEYNESELLRKNPQIKKSQLPNIKSNLYKHLLQTLRHLHRQSMHDIQIRESIDHAKILQSKCMYNASLDVLEKARKSAAEINDEVLIYYTIDLERKIETHYVTGSMSEKASIIRDLSNCAIKEIETTNSLANLSLLLYGLYLKYGYVRDKKDHDFVIDFFNSHMPSVEVEKLNYHQKIYYCQSFVWLYHMVQDFANYFKYSQKWVDHIEEDRSKLELDYSLYLKALHNTMNALYMANKKEKFYIAFDSFSLLEDDVLQNGSINDENNYFLFKYIHLLNKIILTAEYDEGKTQLNGLIGVLKTNRYKWDLNRVMVFYYKIACVYFGADDYNRALDFLNKINNVPISGLRLDIQCFARILSLIAHFELGNETLVKYQILSVYRFLSKIEDLQSVQKEIFSFLRRTPRMSRSDLKKEFIKLRNALEKYTKDHYERRPFLYLDIIAWLDSKIERRRIQDVIKERKENVIA